MKPRKEGSREGGRHVGEDMDRTTRRRWMRRRRRMGDSWKSWLEKGKSEDKFEA